MKPEKSIAILTSGKSRGSNFIAIHKWFRDNQIPVRIKFLTVSDLRAPVIEKCRELGIDCIYHPLKDMPVFEDKLLSYLREHDIDLLALAGFLKKLSSGFITTCNIPILNIHPALLPLYGGKGMFGKHVHEAVFSARAKESGATVHLVNENYDDGKIILQQRISVEDCLTPEEIAERVLKAEHQIYAKAIWKTLNEWKASGKT